MYHPTQKFHINNLKIKQERLSCVPTKVIQFLTIRTDKAQTALKQNIITKEKQSNKNTSKNIKIPNITKNNKYFTLEDVRDYLFAIEYDINDFSDNGTWLSISAAIANEVHSADLEDAINLVIQTFKKSSSYEKSWDDETRKYMRKVHVTTHFNPATKKTLSNIINSEWNKKIWADIDFAKEFATKINNILYNTIGDIWFVCQNGRWIEDHHNVYIRNIVMTKYRDIWQNRLKVSILGENKQIAIKGIKTTGSVSHANSIIKASQYYFQSDKEFDINPNLLAFENGVYDFENMNFRDLRKNDMVTFSTKYNYTNQPNLKIQKEIFTFFENIFTDKKVREYMYQNLSQLLVGGQISQLITFWTGVGRNGKGVLSSLLKILLGEYYTVASSSMWINNKAFDENKPNPMILSVYKQRVLMTTEPPVEDQTGRNLTFNSTLAKCWTGGDGVRARDLFSGKNGLKEVYPLSKPIIQCNSLPNINDLSHGMQRRLNVIPFNTVFTSSPTASNHKLADNNIEKKFGKWAPQLFLILLKYYRNVDLRDIMPDAVKCENNIILTDNSPIQCYLTEFIIKGQGSDILPKSVLYKHFNLWRRTSLCDNYKELSNFSKSKLYQSASGNIQNKPNVQKYGNISYKIGEITEYGELYEIQIKNARLKNCWCGYKLLPLKLKSTDRFSTNEIKSMNFQVNTITN